MAGFTFLFYIAVGVFQTAVLGNTGTAAIVAIFAQRTSAVVLAVTLFRITRPVGAAVAGVAAACRIVEGLLSPPLAIVFFAAGSTLFCWLFLRGLLIPLGLAWVGLFASVVILVGIPLQMGGVLPRTATMILLLPMLAFEVPVGFWLLFKPLRATLPKR